MAVSQVIFGGETLIDLTGDTVSPECLHAGTTAHDKSGAVIVGTALRTRLNDDGSLTILEEGET